MKRSIGFVAALALAAAVVSAATPAAADGYPRGLIGLGLVGPYGYAQDAWVDSYYGTAFGWGWNGPDPVWAYSRSPYGYYGYYGDYHRTPVYGTTYAAPSYVDEDCRIQTQPTAYGWRRYRVCQ